MTVAENAYIPSLERALREAHEATRAYADACRVEPAGPLAGAVDAAPLPPAYRASWGARTLPQPCFLNASEADAAASDCIRLMTLLTELPVRLFGGDLDAYGAALGMPADRRSLLRVATRPAIPPFGRVDMYHDGTALRVLEVNFATDLGGLERSELQRALLEVPAVASFASRFGARHADTVGRLAALMRAAAPSGLRRPAEELSVAIVCGPTGAKKYATLLSGLVEALSRAAVTAMVAELGDIEITAEGALVSGRPVDVVYRFFTVDDLTGNASMAERALALLRTAELGRVGLISSWDTSWFSNKGALALLSAAAADGILDEEDADLVTRRLPWTRLLQPSLRDYVFDRQADLVLKPTRDFGGAGIYVGWEADGDAWRACVDRSLGSDYVVQGRVRPRAEVMVEPGTGALSAWSATWGLFVLDGVPAGLDVRALPREAGAVINYGADSRTRTTGVFVVSTP